MNNTRIEWCDSTWNPVTGCLHECPYCYARKIANRFAPPSSKEMIKDMLEIAERNGVSPTLEHLYKAKPFEAGFYPTFYHHRLDEPQKIKKPQNIFVCSMADLFGDWVPDEWIDEVFKACQSAPQHNYLFLTKNPKKYKQFEYNYFSNMWFGISYTHLVDGIIPGAFEFIKNHNNNLFMSLEPILEPLHFGIVRNYIKWAIVGAETGNRKGKIIPKKEWIDNIVEECRQANIPVFMKDSLVSIIGEENMLREFPEGLGR